MSRTTGASKHRRERECRGIAKEPIMAIWYIARGDKDGYCKGNIFTFIFLLLIYPFLTLLVLLVFTLKIIRVLGNWIIYLSIVNGNYYKNNPSDQWVLDFENKWNIPHKNDINR